MIFFSSTPRLIIYFVLERSSHTPLFFWNEAPTPVFLHPVSVIQSHCKLYWWKWVCVWNWGRCTSGHCAWIFEL